MRWLLLLLCSPALAQVPSAAWQYQDAMRESAWAVFGPGAPIATLAAQIHQESAWRADAKSWAGAEGLAQFMPATARDMARLHPSHCAPADPFSPRWAFACRDRYMHSLNRQTRPMGRGLSQCDVWAFGLRAYNGGLGWINRDRREAMSAHAEPDDWHAVAPYNAGRRASAHKENREYPERIFRIEARYKSWGNALDCL